MTRLRALADTAIAQSGLPVIVMDTAPAAVLGALEDPQVAAHPARSIVNVGNFHTLAFQFRGGRFVRLFEHHTGDADPRRAGRLGGARWPMARIRHEAVFADNGHGALVLDDRPVPLAFVAVVGPRRALLADAGLPIYSRRAARRPDAGRLLRPAARLRRSRAGLARADHRGVGGAGGSEFVVSPGHRLQVSPTNYRSPHAESQYT